MSEPSWDGHSGTAGGARFGAALRSLVSEKAPDVRHFATSAGDDVATLEAVFAGTVRVAVSALARYARALDMRALDFLQRSDLLSLDVYASGLDPLYFLPPGTVRHDARIYMREINPRHAVPERDMFVRNPVLAALAADTVLDDLGKLELQLAYLLHGAVQHTGGTL